MNEGSPTHGAGSILTTTRCLIVAASLLGCQMWNPAFDLRGDGDTSKSGSDDGGTGLEDGGTKGGEGSETGASGDTGSSDDTSSEDTGDPVECMGIPLVGPCPDCLTEHCCLEVDACLLDSGCTCLVSCLYLEAGTQNTCFGECQPDAQSQAVFNELAACVGQSCADACLL